MKQKGSHTNKLIAGIYRPHGQIGQLWNILSDGKPHDKLALSESMSLKHPEARWYALERHGASPKKNQTHSWSLNENAGLVEMRDLKLL
jgi:hypothetical protein